jgi:hypothetical protein
MLPAGSTTGYQLRCVKPLQPKLLLVLTWRCLATDENDVYNAR